MGRASVVGQQAMHIAVATSALVMLCSALLASWRHARTGTLRWRRLWAMLTGIAVGGTAGALLALEASGAWIRWLFVIYLLATVADCYLRAGFMTPPSRRVIPTVPHELTVGGDHWPDRRFSRRGWKRDDRPSDAPSRRADG
ncbi:integral membrane protein [Klebsiella michiganensis]|uniref:Probable membrane transporter protein n=1 Tax=Klebsiella michiganensis TaxID=1134687 RepID=A0A7H4N6L5_9ENTR|nr:integral membrane protein [Klebsiella michiganensis]